MPQRAVVEHGYERWEGNGALGYLVLARIVEAQLFDPPERVRLVVASHCFPTRYLGYWVRKLAEDPRQAQTVLENWFESVEVPVTCCFM